MENHNKPLTRIEEPVPCVQSPTGWHNLTLLVDENYNLKYLSCDCERHHGREAIEGLSLLGSNDTCHDALVQFRLAIEGSNNYYEVFNKYKVCKQVGNDILNNRKSLKQERETNPVWDRQMRNDLARADMNISDAIRRRLKLAAKAYADAYISPGEKGLLGGISRYVPSIRFESVNYLDPNALPMAYSEEKHGRISYALMVDNKTVAWFTDTHKWIKRSIHSYEQWNHSNYGEDTCYYCLKEYNRIARHNPSENHAVGVRRFIDYLVRSVSFSRFKRRGRLLTPKHEGISMLEERAEQAFERVRLERAEEESKARVYTSSNTEIFMD